MQRRYVNFRLGHALGRLLVVRGGDANSNCDGLSQQFGVLLLWGEGKTEVLRVVAATLCVVGLSACTAVTGGGRPAPVANIAIFTPDGCFVRNTAGEMWQVQCEGAVRTPMACYTGGPWGLEEVECPRGVVLRTLAKRQTPTREE